MAPIGLLAYQHRYRRYNSNKKTEGLHNSNNDKGIGSDAMHNEPHETGKKADPESPVVRSFNCFTLLHK